MSVLGITSEGEKLTEEWVKDKNARYAYAYDTSGKLMREMGFTGLPSAMLLDATGRVVWSGHPAGLTADEIEAALAGALPKPLWDWPKEAAGARKALQKGDYAKALEEAKSIEDGQEYADAVQGLIQRHVNVLKAAYERGDYLLAFEASKELKGSLKGLPEAAEAERIHADVKGDSKAQAVIKAQKELLELSAEASELRSKDDANELIETIQELAKDHAGTYAAEEASELVASIREKLPHLR